MPIDISVNRHAVPLQQPLVRQMSVLILADHFQDLALLRVPRLMVQNCRIWVASLQVAFKRC